MKLIGIVIIFLFFDCHGQNILHQQMRLKRQSKKLARREFIKAWRGDEEVSYLSAYLESLQMKFVPVTSFILSAEATNYDSTKQIINYLVPNKKHMLEEVFLIKKHLGSFKKVVPVGGLDCFDTVFHDDDTPCYYFEFEQKGPEYRDFQLKQSYEVLSKHNYSFLFSVRHIINCIFFIENGKVFLISIKDQKIYDPDEFIKQKCSVEIIRDLADGHGLICN